MSNQSKSIFSGINSELMIGAKWLLMYWVVAGVLVFAMMDMMFDPTFLGDFAGYLSLGLLYLGYALTAAYAVLVLFITWIKAVHMSLPPHIAVEYEKHLKLHDKVA